MSNTVNVIGMEEVRLPKESDVVMDLSTPPYLFPERNEYTTITKQKIKLSPSLNDYWNAAIVGFGNKMSAPGQSVQHYAETRNTTKDRAKLNQYQGKKGEIFAMYYLHAQHGFPLQAPSFGIYAVSQKSYEQDLIYNNVGKLFPKVHVKTCTKQTCEWFERYGGYTWQFQKTDDHVFLGKPDKEEFVLFVYFDDHLSEEAMIMGFVPVHVLKQAGYFRNPGFPDHIKDKASVYFQDFGEYVESNSIIKIL